jgi:hypothetical protein
LARRKGKWLQKLEKWIERSREAKKLNERRAWAYIAKSLTEWKPHLLSAIPAKDKEYLNGFAFGEPARIRRLDPSD